MVAIFTGAGAGTERGSGNLLGGAGLLGGSALGRGGEQVLLNAATGNLVIQQRDEMLVGRGPDAVIARTYNSKGDLSDDNGDNWRLSTQRQVRNLTGDVNAAGSTIDRVSGDGSVITYSWNGGAYIATDGAGAYDKITFDGTWRWTDGDSQAVETYGGPGSLISQLTDTSGNSLTYSYGYGDGRLTQLTTANGEYVQYGWSGNDVTQITTSAGGTTTRTRYSYDAYDRLATVTVDLTPDDNSIADGKTYVTSYSYDGSSKRVASVTQTDGSSVTIGYDGANRVHTLTQAVASGVSRTTTIDYYGGYTVVTDAAGQATTLYYDGGNRLTKIVAPPAYAGAAQQTTQFAYTANGDVASVTDAAGNASTYAYDGTGNVLSATDRLGNVVTRTYGSKNELLTETRTGADASGAAVQHTTRYVYDGNDRLRWTVSAAGEVMQHTYDAYGQLSGTYRYPQGVYPVSSLSPSEVPTESQIVNAVLVGSDGNLNQVASRAYDARGNLTFTREATDTGDQPGFTQTHLTYDRTGQLLTSHVDGNYNIRAFVYDGLGRVTASNLASGQVIDVRARFVRATGTTAADLVALA